MGKKHEKQHAISAFQIADREKVLFGVITRDLETGVVQEQRCPVRVAAGAFYGRDDRGLWVFNRPTSEWRGQAAVQVMRFDMERETWFKSTERGTALYRLIQSKLPVWDADDRRALEAAPYGRYHNPRSINKGFRSEVSRREKISERVPINPAEMSSGESFEMGQRTSGEASRYTVESTTYFRRDGLKVDFIKSAHVMYKRER